MAKHRSTLRRGIARWLAIGVGFALVATLAEPVVAAAPPSAVSVTPHTPPFDKPVPVTPVPVKPQPANAKEVASATGEVPAPAWPSAGTADVELGGTARAAAAAQVGGLPIKVASTTRTDKAPASVRVELLDKAAADKAGVAGLLLRVRRTDGVAAPGTVSLTVDYSSIRHAYGANWGSRLRMVRQPYAALESTNDPKAGTLTARVPVTGAATTYAVAAATGGDSGSHAATPLALTGTWQASGQTGDFSWSYPLRVPETPGNLTPQLAVSYSSGSVDGRTASTNNQPSWVGEGFDLWSGSIERAYKSCSDDKVGGNNANHSTSDQCWFTDNATMSLAGHSGKLVRVGTSDTFRLEKDDGTRVERLYGADNGDYDKEYWKATSSDGTQYFFGMNKLPGWTAGKHETQSAWVAPVFGNHSGDPCYKATFLASKCDQGYRWNLDYVVDKHGNTVTYYYAKHRNKYGLDNGRQVAEYDRGGVLLRAEFGTRRGTEYAGPAPAKVVFDTAERCLATTCTPTKENYPDVPFDLQCAAATCPTVVSPTFWTTKRLTKITTYAGAQAVDEWTFSHSFPKPGDGSREALWLTRIGHSGLVGGTATVPTVTFYGRAMENRVNSSSDTAGPLPKYRITGIRNEFGGHVTVNYAPTNCTPATLPKPEQNTLRCFPVYWAPDGGIAFTDWMHKYVVENVVQQDLVGGSPSEVTSYDYLGGGAWRYGDDELIDPKRRTWSEWRGYQRVVVRHGNPTETDTPQSKTEYVYFRGMNGDRLNPAGGVRPASVPDSRGPTSTVPDDDQLNGLVREKVSYNGVGGAVVGSTITDYWQRGPTTTQGSAKAYMVETGGVLDRTALPGGKWRSNQISRTYNDDAQVTQIDDRGDLGTSDDDECTRTWYARNEAALLLRLPYRTQTVAAPCSATPAFPADAVSDVRTYYDGNGTLGAPPTVGNPTKVEQLADYQNGQPVYAVSSRTTYDAFGRPEDSFDALNRKTATRYTEAGGLTTKLTVTNPKGHVTTTELAPAWAEPVKSTDSANGVTEFAYDALGRITGVWLPGRVKDRDSANLRYSYLIRTNGPSAVTTESLRANGNHVASHSLYDGFLRPRQTQSPGWGEGGRLTGRVVTDTVFDSRGMVAKDNGQYYAEGTPATDLVQAGDNNIPSQTVTKYDGAGRAIGTVFKSKNVEQWRSTSEHLGDHTKVTPPLGGTPTTTYLDGDGRVVALHQHRGATPDGPADITKYTYDQKNGELATVTDHAGNQWKYTYDLRGRRIAVDDPDRGESTSTYDAAGQVLTTTDARGETLAFGYDVLGRKTEERLGSPTGPVRATWSFDTLRPGLPDSSTRTENGLTVTTAVAGYEAGSNRPTGEKVVFDGIESELNGTYATSFTYRPDGSIASVALPGKGDLRAETLTLGYDDLGLVRTVNGSLAGYVNDTWYTRFAELSFLSLGDAGARVWNSLYYDDATRRLTRSRVEREKSPGDQVNDFRYEYDKVGNVTSIADRPEGGVADVQCFDHDHLARTVEAWTSTGACPSTPTPETVGGASAYWTSYDYDVTGNRTSEKRHGVGGTGSDVTRTYAHPSPKSAQPHAVTSVTTTGPNGSAVDSFSYDATGNTTKRTLPGSTQTLAWDPAGRLTSATAANGGTTGFAYDAGGERVLRREPGSTTIYVGAQQFELNHATRAVTGTRFYSHGERIVAVRNGTGLYWQAADHHGTVTTTIRAGTLEVGRRQFTPFGETRGTAPSSWPDERGFVGGTQDASLGLTQLGAREYDPALGRFLSVDPIIDHQDPQQMHGYAYANNNPSTLSDPDGLFPDCGCPSDRYGYDNVLHNADGSLLSETDANKWLSPTQKNKWKAKVKRKAEAKKRRQAWEQKIRAAGYTPEEYEEAKKIKEKSVFDVVIEAGGAILSEFLGIEDIKGCFGRGDLGSCISMVINVIPWSKLLRIGELIGAVKKAWKAVTDFRSKRRVLDDVGDPPGSRSSPPGRTDERTENSSNPSEFKADEDDRRAQNESVGEAASSWKNLTEMVDQGMVTPDNIVIDPLTQTALGVGAVIGSAAQIWQRFRRR